MGKETALYECFILQTYCVNVEYNLTLHYARSDNAYCFKSLAAVVTTHLVYMVASMASRLIK